MTDNPKDTTGRWKWRQYACVPATVIWEVGIAMLAGAVKYGPFNFRETPVRASIYVDAAKGHIDQWFEGEDLDPDGPGLSHITMAISSLTVLRDAMIQGSFIDDRPPPSDVAAERDRLQGIMDKLKASASPADVS